jgi:phosphatidate cytidylyltransferase
MAGCQREGACILLVWRLISAAIIVPTMVAVMVLDYTLFPQAPGLILVPLCAVVGALAANEVLSLVRAENYRPVEWSTYAATVLTAISAFAPVAWLASGQDYPEVNVMPAAAWPIFAVGVGLALIFIGEMQRYTKPGGVLVHVALSGFVMLYVGVPLSLLGMLRLHSDSATGIAALVTTLLVVKFADAGAYGFGRIFGRHKMVPTLSPGKTWEGAAGGFFTGAFVSWIALCVYFPWLINTTAPQWWQAVILGVVISASGMVGDLAESLIKRDMKQKDSSRWLPGLGGVLDIIDSILFAAPVAYFFWASGWI